MYHCKRQHESNALAKTGKGLDSDLLCGAKAIAAALGCKPRRIYHIAERGCMPIWNEPGIGLVARKSSLETYFKKREQQALGRERR